MADPAPKTIILNTDTEIDPDEIELHEQIGEGSYGRVYRGFCRSQEVAIKILFTQDLDEDALAALRSEVAIMSKMSHPNIIRYMGASTVPDKVMIVTEMLKGDLRGVIENTGLTLFTRLVIARDMAKGINWLHCSNPMIIHRDIKPGNFLLDDNLRVVVADFGLSDSIKKNTDTYDEGGGYKGTPYYLAPEVLRSEWFNEKVDVYAFGLVLWELLAGKRLWRDLNWGTWDWPDLRQNICIEHARPPVPETWPDQLKQLINACWADDQDNRPNFEAVVVQLNECIVIQGINDPDGQRFWSSTFLGSEMVPWNELVELLAHLLANAPSNPNFEALKAIMVKQQKGVTLKTQELVSIEQFGKCLDWFSPSPLQPSRQWLEAVRELVTQKWFHGEIDVRETEDRLMDQDPGTFLVRFSSSTPGGYALSAINSAGKVQHLRIVHPPGSTVYTVGTSEYRNLHALVEDKAKPLNLTRPCPGSMFASLGRAAAVTNYLSEWN